MGGCAIAEVEDRVWPCEIIVEVVVDQASWLGSILIQVVTFIYFILKISEWLSTYINIQDRK